MDSNVSIEQVIARLLHQPNFCKNVLFAGNQPSPPELAYQVGFPRYEFVVEGALTMQFGCESGHAKEVRMTQDSALFLPDYTWNKPLWDAPVTTLSLLCGKQSLGFSLLKWDGTSFCSADKANIARRGPRTGSFINKAITELCWHQDDQLTAMFLVKSMLAHSLDLLSHPAETPTRSHSVFESIRDYIDNNYQFPLTRESVAAEFYISPNYLSQLFHKEGGIKFNDYLTQTRLEKAKYLLKEYNMKVKEVAHSCGFNDSNYFCRTFRKKTGRSPSEYRVQYRSELA